MSSLNPEHASTHEPVLWPDLLVEEETVEETEVFDAAAHEKALRPTKFNLRQGHEEGTFLLFEGEDPDLNRRQEDQLFDVASEIASVDTRAKRLTAQEDDKKDEAVRIAEESDGQSLRGVRSVPDDFEVQIIPKDTFKVRNPQDLREEAGEDYAKFAKRVTTLTITTPDGQEVDEGKLRAAGAREARRAKVAKDQIEEAVTLRHEVVYDFNKIAQLRESGELNLEKGTIEVERSWAVTPGRLERTSKTAGKKKAKN